MSVFATDNGDIYLRQGDTGNVSFSGLPTDAAYDVYMSIYNPDTDNIISELEATTFTQGSGTALFMIDETFSNALPVGDWEYGLKICDSGTEDTLLPQTKLEGGQIIKEAAPKFTVDYKYVEGA